MNKRRISAQLLLYFFVIMFLVVTVGCSGNFDEPPEKTYVITFDSQDAEVAANPASKTVKCTDWSGCTVGLVGTLPTEPTRTHYAFLGWITEPDCTGIDVTPFTIVTEDITVYACWNNFYTVTFDSQGATVAANPTSKEVIISPEGTATVDTLPTEPTRTGFTFAGWWTGMGGTGQELTAGDIIPASLTVYAYWIP